MGAWSHEPFGYDDASDWAFGLEEVRDLSLIEQTLDKALAAQDSLEAPEASEAVAAVEVLAKLRVESVAIVPGAALLEKGRRALERVLGPNSELRDLWEESGGEEWFESIRVLERALRV